MLRRRSRRPPISPEHRTKLSAKATAQHAARRGYAICADRRDEYRQAYHRLLLLGVTRDEIYRELRHDFEERENGRLRQQGRHP